jgi:hypothetical protein
MDLTLFRVPRLWNKPCFGAMENIAEPLFAGLQIKYDGRNDLADIHSSQSPAARSYERRNPPAY